MLTHRGGRGVQSDGFHGPTGKSIFISDNGIAGTSYSGKVIRVDAETYELQGESQPSTEAVHLLHLLSALYMLGPAGQRKAPLQWFMLPWPAGLLP